MNFRKIILKSTCILLFFLIIAITSYCYMIRIRDFDVDLVYLWCDGDESAFAARKNEWLKKEEKKLSNSATADERFVQVDELKYSLRSVEKYIPWVHHIYIVTDRQVPEWLNTQSPKITIIDHSQIIKKKYIPIFNSNAIETALHKIPGLSEHFLYANDDCFFNRPLDKSFFFRNGKPIVRVKLRKRERKGSLYNNQLDYAIDLIERDFGKIPPFSGRELVPHHNVDAYLKSDYVACAQKYNKEYTKTLTHRFRKKNSVHRLIVSIWSFMKGHAELNVVSSKGRDVDSLNMSNLNKNFLKILRLHNPGVFCINDVHLSLQLDRKRAKQFLDNYFPSKSTFEK